MRRTQVECEQNALWRVHHHLKAQETKWCSLALIMIVQMPSICASSETMTLDSVFNGDIVCTCRRFTKVLGVLML